MASSFTMLIGVAALATACSVPTEAQSSSQSSSLPEPTMLAVVVSHNTIDHRIREEERIWKIPGTGISRTQHSVDGRVVLDTGVDADGTLVTVLHDSGTYRVEPAAPCTDVAKCGPGLPPGEDIFVADGVQRSIADGSMAVVASDLDFEGRPAVRLRGSDDQISLTGTVDMWVDPATNLPFRYRVSGASTERDATVTYVPPTPENLSLLDVPIPPEFRETR